jgi:ABC-type lipoprotein release transport system permease subunit
VAVTLLALVTCGVAAIYPALAAARVSAAEALHYE